MVVVFGDLKWVPTVRHLRWGGSSNKSLITHDCQVSVPRQKFNLWRPGKYSRLY
jgi:hypothetical protein